MLNPKGGKYIYTEHSVGENGGQWWASSEFSREILTTAQHPGLETRGMLKQRAQASLRKECDQNRGQQMSSAVPAL